MPAPKLLMLQQNHIKDSTLTSATLGSSAGASFINGQQNGSTKVVIVTSESMEIEHINRNGITVSQAAPVNNGTDEELTSLTWLHDKNLIKGINNISCPPNIKHINNNHLKILSDGAIIKAGQTQVMPVQMHSKASSSGTTTPNSDLVDDSGVSEDNASSANSSSEHGSIYGRSKALLTVAREMETDDSDTNNSNSTTSATNNKIRANTQLSQSQSHHHHHHHQPPPASSIIHLSPGGSTVVDTSGSTNCVSNTTNPVITTKSNIEVNGNLVKIATTLNQTTHAQSTGFMTSAAGTITTVAGGTSTSAHTHFHKKYIKAMQALNGSSTDSTTVAVVVSSTPPTSISNSMNSAAAHHSMPIAITTSSPTIYTIPMKTTDYSPAKYEHETVIVENEYPPATITLAGTTAHHIYHGNDVDRHSDEYVTPISSPRLQQQPATPQKLTNSINLIAQSPPTVTISQQQPNSIPMPSVSPNSASNQPPKSANGVPYDPFIHTNNKPPLSFSSLIFLAIEDAKEKALPVKEIYAWIVKHYPYFKTAPTGWKNSVRHNLSLNKCFQKVEKAPNMGKGSLWRVEQQYKQNLIIALTRSSYHPNTSAMEKATASLRSAPRSPESPTLKPSNKRSLDSDLFPRLSKYMAGMQNGSNIKTAITINGTTDPMVNPLVDKEFEIHNGNGEFFHTNGESVIVTTTPAAHSNHSHAVHPMHDHDMDAIETQRNVERIARDWGVDSIDDVNAATAMLALKHGPKFFTEPFQTGTPIITSVPSEDHTYSAGGGAKRPTTVNGTNITTVINITPNENETNGNFNGNVTTITPAPLVTSLPTSAIPTTPPHHQPPQPQPQPQPQIQHHQNLHQIQIQQQNDTNHVMNTINDVADNRHSDNISTSSDAAYESSEESQTDISPKELEARRHQEGVDAFLSFANVVSSMSSPIKRPPSADYPENMPIYKQSNNNNHIFTNNNNNNSNSNNNNHTSNGNYYFYDSSSSPSSQIPGQQQHYSYLSSPSPPKKSRTRTLRNKLKKKTWIR